MDWKYELNKKRERAASWFVSKLPRWLIYRATIRAGVHATTGQYENTVVPDLTFIETLKRWEK